MVDLSCVLFSLRGGRRESEVSAMDWKSVRSWRTAVSLLIFQEQCITLFKQTCTYSLVLSFSPASCLVCAPNLVDTGFCQNWSGSSSLWCFGLRVKSYRPWNILLYFFTILYVTSRYPLKTTKIRAYTFLKIKKWWRAETFHTWSLSNMIVFPSHGFKSKGLTKNLKYHQFQVFSGNTP